ncbi:MAG: hypothetical protein M3521_01150 [Acidobacteriota bacterium]|nr:hypothetical protein [Acidobacteriota bacterium]
MSVFPSACAGAIHAKRRARRKVSGKPWRGLPNRTAYLIDNPRGALEMFIDFFKFALQCFDINSDGLNLDTKEKRKTISSTL